MLAATVSTSTPGACNQDPLLEASVPYKHGIKTMMKLVQLFSTQSTFK
jgi:hypothetical protein